MAKTNNENGEPKVDPAKIIAKPPTAVRDGKNSIGDIAAHKSEPKHKPVIKKQEKK